MYVVHAYIHTCCRIYFFLKKKEKKRIQEILLNLLCVFIDSEIPLPLQY